VTGSAATSNWFRSRSSAAGPADAQPTVPHDGLGSFAGASGTDRWAVGKHAAQIVAEPVRGEFTAAGLPTRVPRANLIPGSAGGRPAASGAAGGPGPGSGAQAPAAPQSPQSPWSPEVARARLSGFQRGARRAEAQTDSSPEEPNR
jgi:hypothetical protein